jgi:hypothetical protein
MYVLYICFNNKRSRKKAPLGIESAGLSIEKGEGDV